MNIGVTAGALGSAAGAPLSQTAGAETERAQKDAAGRERTADAQAKSEAAAGVGQTQEDQQSGERDADGRRLWECIGKKDAAGDSHAEPERRVKDPQGISGNSLDLSG